MASFLRDLSAGWLLILLVCCAAACGGGEHGESSAQGPTLWTLPVLPNGAEEITLDGRTVKVGVARPWETESLRFEFMGTETLLDVRLAEGERRDWAAYQDGLVDGELVVRIADVDLMILEGGPKLKAVGLWSVGPRETAEARARQAMAQMASPRDD